MGKKLKAIVDIIQSDPAVDTVAAFTGGGSTRNTARMFIALKPLAERKLSADQVIGRLRKKLTTVPGAPTFLQAVQDLRVGGRMSSAQYQYTLQGDNLNELLTWAPRVEQQLRTLPGIADVNSDQQDKGNETLMVIDRQTASRLGISTQVIDNTLYGAFGQSQVSIMYTLLNQYHVVMEAAPKYWQSQETLKDVYVIAANGTQGNQGVQVPLSSFAHYEPTFTALAVNHQGQSHTVYLAAGTVQYCG